MRSLVRIKAPAFPFLKWVGGKGKLRVTLESLMPKGYRRLRHVEPFVGGGALFFGRRPRRALLADSNQDLIATYEQVRSHLGDVSSYLQGLAGLHCEEHYYDIRDRFNARLWADSAAQRAAMFIYLNKTCFNGLYRVNRDGEFNVPMGSYKNPNVYDSRALALASYVLRRSEARLVCTSFENMSMWVGSDDFVYFDPPYEPVSRTANFTAYVKDGFTTQDQQALSDVFKTLNMRGAKLMLSNSDTPLVHKLYNGFNITRVQAQRSINSDGDGRGLVNELVVRNY